MTICYSFNSRSMQVDYLQFLRVTVHSPPLEVANVNYNINNIVEHLKIASNKQSKIALFPELCISGYTCGDLFYQKNLLDACKKGLKIISKVSAKTNMTCIVGLPIELKGRLYNVAAFISQGNLLGLIPKSYLPNKNEYYENRWFSSGKTELTQTIIFGEQKVLFGPRLLFQARDFEECIFGVDICEDLWAPNPPSSEMALNGGNVFLNLSASNETLGKANYRRDLVKQQSARCLSAYLYASAGPNESTTDTVFSGHCLIAENGVLLKESQLFCFDGSYIISDIDIGRLTHERLKSSVFSTFSSSSTYTTIPFELNLLKKNRDKCFIKNLYRSIPPKPFVPEDKSERSKVCQEIFSIQTAALVKRLKKVGSIKNVIGLSGGLDSTLAFLVTLKAYQILGYSSKDIIVITMPGPGTTQTTKKNAQKLCTLLGASLRTIEITNALNQHFKDIQHEIGQYNIVFENSQARERTQILMDIANQINGIVIGTGDLSEIALGWCTYNGDHMSMYQVNSGVPKTLVYSLVEWFSEVEYKGEIQEVLKSICDTPISPELLPTDGERITQKTEEKIGPYELHDFFIFYMIRYGFHPKKILFLAETAFNKKYNQVTIKKWLIIFYKRFFKYQFKRSAMPDGVKIGSVALSSRTDWRMPSDADVKLWLESLE